MFFTRNLNEANVQSLGFGLGLTVVRLKCQQLGGNVNVESTVGVGSKFSFTVLDAGMPVRSYVENPSEEIPKNYQQMAFSFEKVYSEIKKVNSSRDKKGSSKELESFVAELPEKRNS